MQLLTDIVAGCGSRHGILVDPVGKECQLLRFDRFTRMPRFQLRAGAVIDGVEYCFPLAGAEATGFDFVDQRTTPCTVQFIGMHAASCLKVVLTLATPFRPRDADFSTTPVIAIDLRAEVFPGIFRWKRKSLELESVELFCEVAGEAFEIREQDPDALDLHFQSVRAKVKDDFKDVWDTVDEAVPQVDRLVAIAGERDGRRFRQSVGVGKAADDRRLRLGWCTWSEPALELFGQRRAFRYSSNFASLAAVATWAREQGDEILANAARVDGIVQEHNQGQAVDHLLAYSLHSWLANSWWAVGPDEAPEREWFSVWEGSCYFHSTVDVEFTQSPLYLALWPELLGYELDAWPAFSNPGEAITGERGVGSQYLSHDTGAHAEASRQYYSHDMAVEETSNYCILSYAYWRRSGDDQYLRRHVDTLRAYLAFLQAADSTGNGVPDLGIANTVDDASPAVQFGREQVYLAVKTLGAWVTGAAIFDHLGDAGRADACRQRAELLRQTIEERGWLDDHYAVLLEKSGELTNPWSGQKMACEEIPGWDAAHIYTANAIAVLDLVGCDLGLDAERLRTDLRVAARRCLTTYGCSHSDFANQQMQQHESMLGLAGVAARPGWVSMNMLRDIAAAYRGVDLRHIAERYWEWQVTTNSQEPKLFFETFAGNNLCFYPRGVAIWGCFDALGGLVIDRVADRDEQHPALADVDVPKLFDADWRNGTCQRLTKAP